MKVSNLIYVICTFLLLFEKLCSQTPIYENYTTENGLASDFVYCIFQDSKGLIWVGTGDGVSSYDGRLFTNFNLNDGLSDKEILKIFEDKKGRIWFIGFDGKVCFYFHNKIYNQTNTPWLKHINSNDFIIDYFIDDETQNIYLLNKFSCFLIDSKNSVKKILSNDNDSVSFHAIVEINNKKHIVCSNKLIELSGLKSDLIWEHRFHPLSYIFHNGKNEKLMFINTPNSFIESCFTSKSQYPKFKSDENRQLQAIFQTKDNIFIGANSGLYEISKKSKNVQHLFHDFIVTYIIEDYQGGIWIGSTNKGIVYIPDINIFYISNKSKNQYKNIEVINGRIFIFDDMGNIIEFLNNNTVERCLNKKKVPSQIYNVKKIDSLTYYFCTTGLIEFNRKKNVFEKYIYSVSIKDIEVINDSAYVATSFGLVKASMLDLKKDSYTLRHIGKTKIITNEYTKFLIQNKNKLFAFGVYGIKEIKLDRACNLDVKNHFNNVPINDIKEDNHKNIFIAYSGLGIAKLNCETSHLYAFKTPNELLNCSQLFIDSKNDLWLLSKNGIYKLNESTKLFKKMIGKDAFINNKIIDFIVTDSAIVAISKNKIFKIPLDFKDLTMAPKSVEFTSISFNDKLVNDSIINLIQESENVLRFDFKSYYYNNQTAISYKYILKGVDKLMHYTKATEIRYTSLPIGNYEFEISACIDENRSLASPSKKVKITITAPWYKSNWFKYLIIAVTFLIIILLIKTRYNRLKAQLTLKNRLTEIEMDKLIFKKDLIQLEQKALLTQMNPHFIFNSLNTMQSFYLTGETKKATQYLNLFSKLLRQILETSSKDFISLEKERENMINYANLFNLKLENNFEFQFNINGDIDAFEMQIPTMIIQPFIENSLLHGISNHKTKGIIVVNITEQSEKSVKVTITDNGIGRAMAAKNKVNTTEYESMGLTITQKRIEHINVLENISTTINFTDLKYGDGTPAGTQVEFFLLYKFLD